jgi:cytosine/adenosine deaminase-related metal-dependent hydrolase
MTKILVDSCEVVVVMDDAGTEVIGGSILIEDGQIAWVGSGEPPDAGEAERVDGRGTVAVPGLINTHHHLYQAMTRTRAREQGLFGWLTELYPVWAGLNSQWERAAAAVGLAELASPGARPQPTITMSSPRAQMACSRPRSTPHERSGSASIPAGDRWTSGHLLAGFRLTRSARTRTPSSITPRR